MSSGQRLKGFGLNQSTCGKPPLSLAKEGRPQSHFLPPKLDLISSHTLTQRSWKQVGFLWLSNQLQPFPRASSPSPFPDLVTNRSIGTTRSLARTAEKSYRVPRHRSTSHARQVTSETRLADLHVDRIPASFDNRNNDRALMFCSAFVENYQSKIKKGEFTSKTTFATAFPKPITCRSCGAELNYTDGNVGYDGSNCTYQSYHSSENTVSCKKKRKGQQKGSEF